MLIELLWVGVYRVALSLDQNGIGNVLILFNYYTGPHWILIQYSTDPHQRHVVDRCTLI